MQGYSAPPANFQNWLQQNPGMVMTLAAGLLGGRQALPQAVAAMPRAMTQDRQTALQQRQREALAKFMQGPRAQALDPATRELLGASDPGPVINSLAQNAFGMNKVHGTPIYYDDDGTVGVGTIDQQGNFRPAPGTEGLNILTPTTTINTKDEILTRNRAGDVVSRDTVNNAGAAADTARGTAEGKSLGEARALYESMVSKMPSLETVVLQLDQLADKATYTAAGQARDLFRRQMGMEPTEEAIARAEYIAMVDNQILPLLRDTFGAQFTVEEGKALRATLGDPDKAPAEKKAVLRAFIEQKRRRIEELATQSGVQSSGPPPGVDPAEWGAMTPEERALWK